MGDQKPSTRKPTGYKNPPGRPKGVPNKASFDIKALAQVHGPECIRMAVAIMKTAKAADTRLKAMSLLLDRGYGRPIQAIEGTGTNGAILLEFKGFD